MGERKTFDAPAPDGRDERGPRGRRPLLSREAPASNHEVTSNLPWTATLEAKRAGWERDWTSDHLEPFLWVVGEGE
jgi:hypothetical protein